MRFAVCFSILCLAWPAQAQMPPACAPLESMLSELHEHFAEVPEWEGLVTVPRPGQAIILQSPCGSWTIIHIMGTMACVLAAGKAGTSIVTGQET